MFIPIEEYNEFYDLKDISRKEITTDLIESIRTFREEADLEEMILNAISDPNRTPHGPSEIVDIMTLNLSYRKKMGLAGFVLKGCSFKTVTPENLSHQVYRFRKISDLQFAVLGHIGNLLDPAREEFISTAEDLRVDYTIIDANDFARMAIAYGILCPHDGFRIKEGKCSCGYRVSGDSLNYLQKEALERLRDVHELQQESGLVIMPTGSGKTRIAAIDSKSYEAKRILYIAHTHEILEGAKKEFEHIYGTENVFLGISNHGSDNSNTVNLCTIQSFSKKEEKEIPKYDYAIFDEFHHAAASSYKSLLSKIKPEFLLGLTATPFRGDKVDVIEICNGNVVVNFELRTGINNEILVPYQYHGCFDSIDYSDIKRKALGYTIKDLDKKLVIPERDKGIIDKWISKSNRRPTIAFCCSRKHAERVAESFKKAGITAEPYLGDTPFNQRLSIAERFKNRETEVICSVDVLNEGVDIPFVECLLFLRPTESKRIFFQQLGRGLRKYPGKKNVLVLDFIGNFYNAYKVVEYLNLEPDEKINYFDSRTFRTPKEYLNLPLGCSIEFEDRVIDIFEQQITDPRNINRHNIAQILLLTYERTSKRLGHYASKAEIDRSQILHSGYYSILFGTWKNFQKLYEKQNYNSNK